MDEVISIIVPVYNVEKYLEKCLNSIIKQTYKNIEIILVDDGSTDDSGKICDEYSKIDKRIHVIHKKNGGLSDARNTGINVVNGKYIGFVDSDDYIEEDMYEVLYNNLKEYNADISICEYARIRLDEKNKIKRKKNRREIIDKENAMQQLIKDKKVNSFAWNKLYKKELFCDIRYPVGKIFEDIGTTYLLLEKSKKIIYDNRIKYYYVDSSSNMASNVHKVKMVEDYMQMVNNMISYVKKSYPNLKQDIELAIVKYNVNFHTLCIKKEFENFYYNNEQLMEHYKIYRNICKNKGLINALSECNLKHKIFGIMLYYNRNFTYRIGNKLYKR